MKNGTKNVLRSTFPHLHKLCFFYKTNLPYLIGTITSQYISEDFGAAQTVKVSLCSPVSSTVMPSLDSEGGPYTVTKARSASGYSCNMQVL